MKTLESPKYSNDIPPSLLARLKAIYKHSNSLDEDLKRIDFAQPNFQYIYNLYLQTYQIEINEIIELEIKNLYNHPSAIQEISQQAKIFLSNVKTTADQLLEAIKSAKNTERQKQLTKLILLTICTIFYKKICEEIPKIQTRNQVRVVTNNF